MGEKTSSKSFGENKMKSIIIVLSTLALTFTSLASTYLGEEATLESIYESKARSVLNTLLRPQDYSIVVSAEINVDDQELAEFREEIEMRFLPGLPLEANNEMSAANNELHKLKEKVDINIILNTEVEDSKKSLITNLLTSKLHLDTEGGDRVNIVKTRMPASILPKTPKPVVEKEKTIPFHNLMFYLGLATLVFAAFCLWLFKSRKKEPSGSLPVYPLEESNKDSVFNNQYTHQNVPAEAPENNFEAEERERALAEELKQKEEREAFLSSLKTESLTLMTEYPNLCVDGISELIREGKSKEVIAFFETIGWDDARRLMSNLPIKLWANLGSVLKNRQDQPSKEYYDKSLEACHKILVAKVISHGVNEDKDNPFSFLFTLPYAQKKQVYENEDVSNVAIIALFSNSADLQDIFNFLTTERKKDVVLKIAEFQNLSDMEIKLFRNKLLERLNNIKTRGGIVANGPEVAAKVLRSLPASKEQEIFNFIEKTDIKMAKNIGSFSLQFTDLPFIPRRYQEIVYEEMEVESLVTCLFGVNENVQQFIIEILPKNKARMVSSDLQSNILSPTKEEVANIRRKIVTEIEGRIEKSGESLGSFIRERAS